MQEVNAADIVVAEALFQRFPEIREAVVQNREHFTGSYWSIDNELASADWSMFMGGPKEERWTRWQACLPEDSAERKSATAALNFLFPMTNATILAFVRRKRFRQAFQREQIETSNCAHRGAIRTSDAPQDREPF